MVITNLFTSSPMDSDTVPSPPDAALILVAHGDEQVRHRLRQMMEDDGYRVIEANKGQDCLTIFIQFHPTLVLLSAHLPGLDGFDCCRHLKALPVNQQAPILMMTNRRDLDLVDQAFAAGAVDYITQPIHPGVLRQRVQRLLQQAELYHQVQQLNSDLEQQVQERTRQLQQALELEATLKRITDKVRDSLDESQILQNAVEELALALGTSCCNAALYDRTRNTANVCYEHRISTSGYQGHVVQMDDYPEIYHQLWDGLYFQFCSIIPHPLRGRVSMFTCPIMSTEGSIGDLWLISQAERSLHELEIRLIQQVANQCAIAIRQARLYQAAQAHVAELEKLNRLKDDFLSTISHELRSPMSNIRMAIQMLEQLVQQSQTSNNPSSQALPASSKSIAYLQILHSECDREIHLINDLLDLQRLEADYQCLVWTTLDLQHWLPALVAPFRKRAQSRQQYLTLNLPKQLPPLVSDATSLERVFTELLHNACKYTPPQETICVSATCNHRTLQLAVSNSGVEIPLSEQARIFDKFYRIPHSDPWKQGGTGLGLALVKKLVEHLGGAIAVNSTSGITSFTVELPLNAA